MISFFTQAMSMPFMQRAVIVGALISLCAALLGVNLVLKRYSMIGDGLSHVGFAALAIASAVGAAPLQVALPLVIVAAFLLLRISENSKIRGDAAIALIATGALAIGVIVSSLSGSNTDLNSYLFGSLLVVESSDVVLTVALSVVVLIMFVLLYNRIFAVTFDEVFTRSAGARVGLINIFISIMAAVTIVLGMRMMGTLLISSLIIFPAITSMRVCKRFRSVTITSAVISIVCFFVGIISSYIFSIPTGAGIVAVNLVALCLFSMVSFFIGKLKNPA